MKIKSHTLALCMIFSCHYPQAYSESSLPTSAANIDTATSTAQSVLICRLTDLGWVDFKGPSTTAYDEAKFEVIKTLKGDPITRIVCSLLVLAPPLEANEKAPKVGENYIVIGNHIEGKFTLSSHGWRLSCFCNKVSTGTFAKSSRIESNRTDEQIANQSSYFTTHLDYPHDVGHVCRWPALDVAQKGQMIGRKKDARRAETGKL